MSKELGERIRTLMRKYGITQAQLAKRSGSSQPSISKYLSGESEPKAETLANIATVLHTTSSELLGMEPMRMETPYGVIKDFCARHGGDLSNEEVRDLIMTLLSAQEVGDGHNI